MSTVEWKSLGTPPWKWYVDESLYTMEVYRRIGKTIWEWELRNEVSQQLLAYGEHNDVDVAKADIVAAMRERFKEYECD